MKISNKNIKGIYSKLDQTIYGHKNVADSLAVLYHENSKFTSYSLRKLGEMTSAFYSPYITERASQPYKCYPGNPLISLEDYKDIPMPDISFFDLLAQRRSVREYEANYQLSLNELFVMLHHSYGVTYKMKIDNVEGHLGWRNVPSPGALYPLEVYIVTLQSQVPTGLYHFRPDTTTLEELKQGDFLPELRTIIQAEPFIDIGSASAVVLVTGMIERVMIKYGDRGYRFMLHESGCLAQTIGLLCESIGLGSCMVGGYIDNKINKFLGVDGVYETIQNVMIVGKKKKQEHCNQDHCDHDH